MSTDAKTRRGLAAATSRRRGAERASSRGSPAQQDHRRLDYHVFPDDLGGLGAAAPRCDLERRVHGAALLGAFSPCFHGSSSSHLPPQHSSEEVSAAAAAREQEQTLRLFLQDIERSIVFGICKNPETTEFFRDHRRRLDDYFAAAKNLLQMLEHPVLAYGDLHNRAKSLLVTAMGSLAVELCHLKIWKPDALASYLGCTPTSIWELARSSCRGGGGGSGSASSASWMSTSRSCSGGSSGPNGVSFDGYYMALSEERTVRSGQASSVTASHIDLKSVSILNKIADFMIGVGHEQMLRGAFDQHSEHLVRYIEILDIDKILGNHMEESTELLLKVWTSTMRTVLSVLDEMRTHLNQKDHGTFSSLKVDYFSAIAKESVMKLLNYANAICIQVGPNDPSCRDTHASVKHYPSKMANLLIMFQALEYAKMEILDLFLGQTKGPILMEIERLTNGLSAVFLVLLVELNGLLRSQHLVISNTGVHHVTQHIMGLMRLLVEQKDKVHMMLNDNPDKFGQVVTQLISSLEFMLDMNSRSLALQGQQQVFLLNNINFVLEQANNYTDLKLILGESWCLQRHVQLDQFLASYVEASWTPVMSSFIITRIPKILWPQQLFDKFNSRFEMTYNVQKTWKVTDPVIGQKLREKITQKVIPLYRMYLESYSDKKQKSARFNVEHLEARLLEIFEG
ncbi:exocyst complex component EXO70E2-like [Oryza glaberrima]|uniref:Exocyst subunit Exo70 family protein n=1 Tax=Oryza glaberrima TaxID=4538 RepID=I1NN86_ORYGL|nr:exocyst complex component EXO70E2-like [Oryza glaberrima]